MTQKIRLRVIGEEDGEKVKEAVFVDAYDRLEDKALMERIVAEQMSEMDDSDENECCEENQRLFHLGVDRDNLIELFGRNVYHAVFAELDADARLRTMLEMLDE